MEDPLYEGRTSGPFRDNGKMGKKRHSEDPGDGRRVGAGMERYHDWDTRQLSGQLYKVRYTFGVEGVESLVERK